jgi:hypothetical protein
VKGQGQEFTPTGFGGEVTDQAGQSDVDLEPATEKQPGVGTIVNGSVIVYASLDKDQVPDALGAFLANRSIVIDTLKGKATNWSKFLFDAAFDISLKAIMRAGMPVKKTTINVEYHGADMYLVAGTRHPFALYYLTRANVFAYTCEGLNGLWKGTFLFHADKSGLAAMLELFGGELPATVDGEKTINQFVDLRSGPAPLYLEGNWDLFLEVDPTHVARGQYGVVGTATLRAEGLPLEWLLLYDPVSEIEILRLDKENAEDVDEYCPGSESYFP